MTAQILSRLMLAIVVTLLLYGATRFLLDVRMEGSGLALFLVAVLASISLVVDRAGDGGPGHQRGTGRRSAEPGDVADDAAVRRVVLTGRRAASGCSSSRTSSR